MLIVFTFKPPLAPGLLRIHRDDTNPRPHQRNALWVSGKTRKAWKCVVCLSACEKGAVAFRPLGNVLYRYERICEPCAAQGQKVGVLKCS